MRTSKDELLYAVKKAKQFISESTITAHNRALLLLAAEYGHLDIVKYLIEKG